jgi:hypothetical protein
MNVHQSEIAQLQGKIAKLESENETLKLIASNPSPFSVDTHPQRLPNAGLINKSLDVPLAKIIEIYREYPQILEPYAKIVAVENENLLPKSNAIDQPLYFHVSPYGPFWVIQLKDQGDYLFPRPSDLKRITRINNLDQIFSIKKGATNDSNQLILLNAAKLKVCRNHEDWHLEEIGSIVYGTSSLPCESHKKIPNSINEMGKFKQPLINYGNSFFGVREIVMKLQQDLEDKYGPLNAIVINTCTFFAYAVYKDGVYVPCELLMSSRPIVVPELDKVNHWNDTIYSKWHSSSHITKTPRDHPLLPNQVFLLEKKGANDQHTWAIAKSYPAASTILEKLIKNWGPLV